MASERARQAAASWYHCPEPDTTASRLADDIQQAIDDETADLRELLAEVVAAKTQLGNDGGYLCLECGLYVRQGDAHDCLITRIHAKLEATK